MLAACGTFGGLPLPTPSTPEPTSIATAEMMPTPTPTSTGSPTPSGTKTGGQASIATMTGGNGMGRKLVLGAGAVTAGWTDSTPRETGGYRMTICGVDLEPSAPIDGAQKRWQNSPNGPFLEQHVRVYADKTAANVMAGLSRAIPSCPGYTAVDAGGGSATYTVERLAVPGAGAGFVTWRQKLTLPQPSAAPTSVPTSVPSATALPTATAAPTTAAPTTAAPQAAAPVLIQDVAVTKRGTSIILLASYAVDVAPQPQVLATAVKALGPG